MAVSGRAKKSVEALRAEGYLLLDEVVRAARERGIYWIGRRTVRDLQALKLIPAPLHTRGLGSRQPDTSWYPPDTVARIGKIYAQKSGGKTLAELEEEAVADVVQPIVRRYFARLPRARQKAIVKEAVRKHSIGGKVAGEVAAEFPDTVLEVQRVPGGKAWHWQIVRRATLPQGVALQVESAGHPQAFPVPFPGWLVLREAQETVSGKEILRTGGDTIRSRNEVSRWKDGEVAVAWHLLGGYDVIRRDFLDGHPEIAFKRATVTASFVQKTRRELERRFLRDVKGRAPK